MRDVIDMKSATGNIGGNKHLQFAFFEIIERTNALILRHFTRQHADANAIAMQIVCKLAHLITTIAKHHDALGLRLVDEVIQ